MANSYTDVAGNAGSTATSANYTVETKSPTATILLSDSALKIGDTSLVTVTFSEPVSGFDVNDLTVQNGTLGAMTTSDNITWTGTFTPTSNIEDTTNVITLANTYSDSVGNVGTIALSPNYGVDTKTPTASIMLSKTSLVNGDTSTVTVTFSEAVTGFSSSDLTADNGTIGTMTSNDGGVTWTGTFTPAVHVNDTSNTMALADTYTDVAGNTGTTATTENYMIDTPAMLRYLGFDTDVTYMTSGNFTNTTRLPLNSYEIPFVDSNTPGVDTAQDAHQYSAGIVISLLDRIQVGDVINIYLDGSKYTFGGALPNGITVTQAMKDNGAFNTGEIDFQGPGDTQLSGSASVELQVVRNNIVIDRDDTWQYQW